MALGEAATGCGAGVVEEVFVPLGVSVPWVEPVGPRRGIMVICPIGAALGRGDAVVGVAGCVQPLGVEATVFDGLGVPVLFEGRAPAFAAMGRLGAGVIGVIVPVAALVLFQLLGALVVVPPVEALPAIGVEPFADALVSLSPRGQSVVEPVEPSFMSFGAAFAKVDEPPLFGVVSFIGALSIVELPEVEPSGVFVANWLACGVAGGLSPCEARCEISRSWARA